MADATQVLQTETDGAEEQFTFRDVDTPRRIRSGDGGKASRQRRTLCLAHFGNFEVWCWDCVDPLAKVTVLITVLISSVRVRFSRVACEIVFQSLHQETGASIHVER